VMLEHVPVARMSLPITGFGNLTTSDAHRLGDVVSSAASGWPAPTVRFAGGTALDFPGDWSVWAKLDGDLDAVGAIARGVTQSVESLGYFVDRRQFRPMLSVATVTPATTGPYLQAIVDALDAFRGEEWTVAISLTKETFVEGRPELTEFQRIPLAP
jgi:2'-5' RNA ligase